jgi:hypothetical protein
MQLAKPRSHVDVHVVPVQVREPVLVPEQTRPHAPQLKTSSTTTVSQPLSISGATGFVQSPNPASHVGVHNPAAQAVPTAFTPEQTCPQPPQLAVEVRTSISQPSVGSPLQSAKFAEQFKPHVPLKHVAVELGPLGQAFPHAPQFDTAPMFTSQPLPGAKSQSAQPMAHDSIAHIPMTHASLAFARLHALLQNAQFCTVPSNVSHPSAPLPLQFAVPPPHGLSLQVPFEHVWNALHIVPHTPQLLGSLKRIASQPLPAFVSQLANPGLHWPTLHAPLWHNPIAFGAVHNVSHAPQLFASDAVATSQPFVPMPSQSSNPGEHVSMAQAPPEHVAIAFATAQGEHALPQP